MPRLDGMVRDRDGELVPAPEEEHGRHECRSGWIGPASEPAPCPVCRPGTVARLAEQRRRAQDRAAGIYAPPPTRPALPAAQNRPPETNPTPEEAPPMSTNPTPSTTVHVDLAADDVALVAELLREQAEQITNESVLAAAHLVTSNGDGERRDPRTKALHLAQRLARAVDYRRVADQLAAAHETTQTR